MMGISVAKYKTCLFQESFSKPTGLILILKFHSIV